MPASAGLSPVTAGVGGLVGVVDSLDMVQEPVTCAGEDGLNPVLAQLARDLRL